MAIAQFNAGVVYEECGQGDKAEPIYSGLISAAPKFDLPYNNLGVIYWKKGQDSKALDMFKKGVEANKLSARAARNNVAGLMRNQYISNMDLNVFNEAEKSIQGVLALDSATRPPTRTSPASTTTAVTSRTSRTSCSPTWSSPRACACSRKRTRRAPTSSTSRASSCWRGTTRSTRSRPSRRPSNRAEPRRGQPQHRLHLDPLPRLHDRREGLPDRPQVGAQQKNIEVWLALGVAQRGLKKFKEAEESYNKALKLNASDPRPGSTSGSSTRITCRCRTAST
jgi:tetratricopeptide (TPR) repeat protein